jgi:hypothetical protein
MKLPGGIEIILAVLTRREWILLFKVIAIVLLAIVLLIAKIAMKYPAEQFIYGRF